jgi:integrase
MGQTLASLDADAVVRWYRGEKKRSPVQATRAAAMLSGMLRWASAQPEYKTLVQDRHAASSETLAEFLPQVRKREDRVERGQLSAFFAAVGRLRSPVARAYIQAVLLTGARREEMARVQWSDIDFKWKTLRLADKVGDFRILPLTPYLETLLGSLPRVATEEGKPSPWVFATASVRGHITEARASLERACAEAGVPHVTIHGLRRSYAGLAESSGVPAGVGAQIMGHRPSATHEGYKIRSIDDLRPHAERVEGYILAEAGVALPTVSTRGRLTVVA